MYSMCILYLLHNAQVALLITSRRLQHAEKLGIEIRLAMSESDNLEWYVDTPAKLLSKMMRKVCSDIETV